MTDTVKNVANVAAGGSTTRCYLSKDTTPGGDILLTGSRTVAALGANALSTGTVTVTVPSTTQTGVCNLFACADDLKVARRCRTPTTAAWRRGW